jgi:hypothetical protein
MKTHTFKIKQGGEVVATYKLETLKSYDRYGKEKKPPVYAKNNLRENYYEPRRLPDYEYYEREHFRQIDKPIPVSIPINTSSGYEGVEFLGKLTGFIFVLVVGVLFMILAMAVIDTIMGY